MKEDRIDYLAESARILLEIGGYEGTFDAQGWARATLKALDDMEEDTANSWA